MKKILVLLFCFLVLLLTACGGPEKKAEKPAEPAKKEEPAKPAEPSKNAEGKQVLNLFSWADNFDPEVLADFEKKILKRNSTVRLTMMYLPTTKNFWLKFRLAEHAMT